MAPYSARVRQDIARWVDKGLIDAATGQVLAGDVEANESRLFSFGFVLAIMAALLLGAALLLLVAANWEVIPRLLRVTGLFAIIVVSYVGGALLKRRGQGAIAEALWLVGAAAFGGSIALIGQMYHLDGDESAAMLVWCVGTAFAAAMLRSGPLTVAAAGIGTVWMVVTVFNDWDLHALPHLFVVIAAIVWLVSYWTGSIRARHVILLSLILYAGLFGILHDATGTGIALAMISAAVFALAVYLPQHVEAVVRLRGRLAVHCLIGFLCGLAMVHIDQVDEAGRLVIAALVTFGGVAAALYLAGRDSRMLRWIAYAGFGLELCFLYIVMISSMLGTAGLFLASGIVLGIIAIVIIRVERRIKDGPLKQAGAA